MFILTSARQNCLLNTWKILANLNIPVIFQTLNSLIFLFQLNEFTLISSFSKLDFINKDLLIM